MADVLWEWQNPFGWSQYDEEASTAIENAYQQKQKAVYLLEGQYGANGGYLLSLDHMTQTNMDSGNERKIRRRAVDEGETQDRKDRKDKRADRSLHDVEEDDWDDSNTSASLPASQGYSRHTLRSQTQKLSQSPSQSRSNSGNLTRLLPPSLRSSSSDLSQSNAPLHFLRSASNSVGSQSISRSNSANLSQHSVSGYHARSNSSNNLSQPTTQASSTNAPTMTTKRLRSEKSEKSSQGLELEASMPIPIPKKKATGASFPVPSPVHAQSFPTPGYAPPFSFKTIPASSSFPLAHDDSFLVCSIRRVM